MSNRPFWTLAFASLAALFGIAQPTNAKEPSDAARLEFFESKIRPVLVEHCYRCHAADSNPIQGGLRVDSKQGLLQGGDLGESIVVGKPDESLLIAAMRYEGPEMPPKGKLPDRVVADFERWIRDGAIDPRDDPTAIVKRPSIDFEAAGKFWSFQRPEAKSPPTVRHSDWVANPIDPFVLARLEQAGLKPSATASPEVLVRRAYFDLVGLPPTPEQVSQFLAEAEADPEAAWKNLVDRLLDSEQYGERWARHWLDVARYAEDQAHTFKARKYPRGYYYRDWVVRSLNEDLPYDEFVARQIAGDLLPGENQHERIAALGLFALGPVYYAENVEKAKAAADEWDDRVDTLMRGVLGLTASCARCHDHKYDPITMEDYYGLAGVFASSRYAERPLVSSSVLAQRKQADDDANQQQRRVDQHLAEQARALRPTLAAEIPAYFTGAWKLHHLRNSAGNKKPSKKEAAARLKKVAKEFDVNPGLLQRWLDFCSTLEKRSKQEQDFFADWQRLLERQKKESMEPLSAECLDIVAKAGEQIRDRANELLPDRGPLLKRFGENAAFVKQADRADVPAGVIPLGNLFDDSASVALRAALATDRFGATASSNSLGVDRVSQGWGKRTEIAPGIKFDFAKLGSDSRRHGSIVNDAWDGSGGIITQGRRQSRSKREEQGIGMHANALITFDLAEIRQAGLWPADQKFVLRVDRAGLNDDVFGSGASAHVAVVVSRPPSDKTVTDAILATYVNGQPRDVATDDFTYYVAGDIGDPLKGDGQFVTMAVPVPADARYVTLVATGAGSPDDNSISSDHVVFSGVRLELDPPPAPAKAAASAVVDNTPSATAEDDRGRAVVLSRLLYDEGLLALPPSDARSRLSDESKATLQTMEKELATLKKAAEAIKIPLAHALDEAAGKDIPIYLQGNPAKQGDQAPRALPAILTDGKKRPFESSGSGRLELARAVASEENPLTARVIVNRVWAGHFGHGLVRTPSNFGQLGERPSHPDLLDDLAFRFMQEGWSLKWLHREIMNSSTYRQASEFSPASYQADPENRLLWRMNRRRLEIEPWRDGMLAVTGELDQTMGGPSMDLGRSNNLRRTLYGFVSRHRLNELLRLFDFPDPNITSARRVVTTVPLQQLFVLNSDFMIRRARALATRLKKLEVMDDAARVDYGHQLLYGRNAAADEIELAIQFLTADQVDSGQAQAETKDGLDRWEQYALALLSANEFMYLD